MGDKVNTLNTEVEGLVERAKNLAGQDYKPAAGFSRTLMECAEMMTALQAENSRLTAELAEAREKNGTLIEKINAKRPRLESNHDYSRGWNDACFAVSQIDPDATATLAARDKRVRAETLNAANVYLTVQYGIMALGHHIDRDRILARLDQLKEPTP